ncbi:hypothetical protein GH714_001814 [Hevea brasiliensis]|uniref:PA domain-containing protein n=1 Tax=Hevea brasiliensis TaxID=3981 RepID=A0A6A6MAY0_HEVBR|nr:hypothetical protein GH714_001814 [Hevea brasiliensis]
MDIKLLCLAEIANGKKNVARNYAELRRAMGRNHEAVMNLSLPLCLQPIVEELTVLVRDNCPEDTIDSFLFYTLLLIASGNLNHIQQNKMILGAWVHQVLEQQMPSSDIPSKILCQVIKIDLQDMQQQTPCQQLMPKDLHGNEWHFEHVNQISLFVNCYFTLKAWNAQNGGALAILVLDDKNEKMITMDTSEEENADADYLPRCIRALYTMLSLLVAPPGFRNSLPTKIRNLELKILLTRRKNKDIGRLKGERIYYQRRLHSKRWGNNVGRYGQEDSAVGSLPQALPANPVHGERIKAWNAQNGGALAILVLDDKNEQMITMDTPEEENADADYLPI